MIWAGILIANNVILGIMEWMQEYYIRHKDGRTVDSHAERQKVSRSLRSAVERRATHVRL